jgi:ankyrin repeat protein
MHCAAMKGHLDVVVTLVEAGPVSKICDTSENTPLFWGVIGGHEKVVDYLYEDADKYVEDDMRRTAMHLAAATGVVKIANLLLDKCRTPYSRTSVREE